MSTAEHWEEDLDLILHAARQAGEVAYGFFGQAPEVWWKNEGRSPVSAADFAANDRLESLLRKARPDYGWLSEETDDDVARLSCETLFVVDPIDGTRAFINGEKTWCVSVAVVHRGQPVAGVLVAPALNEEFSAVKDGPALKNDDPITVSVGHADNKLVIAADEALVKKFDPAFREMVHRVGHIPSLAYRLAMVADGRIDGTIVRRNSHDWDLAAADLVVERAGGRLVDLDGRRLVYNRTDVRHEMLVAGAERAVRDLLPKVAGGAG
ncbi:myo-inositol-1(or 4)-monophosphatase [Rhizobium petrolearium]|uniref:3'(2'),5'-bisphosphate nucleotidase CysQ n=1 Tax=Neorhizobium petrolearium TaxID=515361 RepID=UPI001AEB6A02|nr:3'(2'),5'-bisphosphate nucleotidase CysQ [Neorhizobium petrolearium]MBP1842301.1 myo-inositol-1(or 4)-monophosphatase [Neorhizobium petrolearium]